MQCVQCSHCPGLSRVPPSQPACCSTPPLHRTPKDSMGCPASTCHCLCPSKQTKEPHSTIRRGHYKHSHFCGVEGQGYGFWVQGSQFRRLHSSSLPLERPKISRIICPALPCLASMRVHSKSYEKILNHFGLRFKNYILCPK